jgi:Domain of unknown function (DUF1996)
LCSRVDDQFRLSGGPHGPERFQGSKISQNSNQWTHPFVLSSGDPTGYGLHGDFYNGWNVFILQEALNKCNASSGAGEDCPAFNGLLQAAYTENACNIGMLPEEGGLIVVSLWDEPVQGILDQPQGCNPVEFWGPANAIAVTNCNKTKAIQLTSSPTTATTTPTPSLPHFTQMFSGLLKAPSGAGYMMYTTLTSYSAELCAKRCVTDPVGNCVSFNMYVENRPAGTDVICTLWNVVKYFGDATNFPDSASLNFTLSEGFVLSSHLLLWSSLSVVATLSLSKSVKSSSTSSVSKTSSVGTVLKSVDDFDGGEDINIFGENIEFPTKKTSSSSTKTSSLSKNTSSSSRKTTFTSTKRQLRHKRQRCTDSWLPLKMLHSVIQFNVLHQRRLRDLLLC